MEALTVAELCTGGGGQAIGLERAGFTPRVLAEIDMDCCRTLQLNRPHWPVLQGDITAMPGLADSIEGRIHLLAAGLPCTPHSRGGRQLGTDDERHLWDAALGHIAALRPRAVMLETSNAILSGRFDDERNGTLTTLGQLGYIVPAWREIDCSWYGVPQRRRRAVLVAFLSARAAFRRFTWPQPDPELPPTVGEALYPLAGAGGWFPGAAHWAAKADGIAPTVVGGSTKHGGADLGASQGKAAWRRLGIDPMGIADGPPGPDGKYPRSRGVIRDVADSGLMLTVEMAARLQGFPPDWEFSGGKTARYRQVGNAFCPPAAEAIGRSIAAALRA
jgi:DNA (cytosine-5)-methyltransferase 1